MSPTLDECPSWEKGRFLLKRLGSRERHRILRPELGEPAFDFAFLQRRFVHVGHGQLEGPRLSRGGGGCGDELAVAQVQRVKRTGQQDERDIPFSLHTSVREAHDPADNPGEQLVQRLGPPVSCTEVEVLHFQGVPAGQREERLPPCSPPPQSPPLGGRI